jgi:ACS family hexuronate transporter-like MFS transporter
MGLLIDRAGLRSGVSVVVGLWSLAGAGTGFAISYGHLLAFRAMLGFAESGGIPATAKGAAVYLEPQDRALGSAITQFGLTLGTMAAPILTEFFSARWGWRSAFVACGVLGFAWIPVWLITASRVPPASVKADPVKVPFGSILRDRRYQVLVAANALAMTVYSLWFGWTTLFLVNVYGLTQSEANLRYAWIPAIFATLGGLCGGWIAQRLIRAGGDVIPARLRIALISSVFAVMTAAAPVAGSPGLAILCVCISLFALVCLSVNYYSIPLDLFGADRAAFAVSFLTGMFGLTNVFLSPQIGRWSDTVGWQPVCFFVALLPLVSALALRVVFRTQP